MKKLILSLVLAVVTLFSSESFATQADDTTIEIIGQKRWTDSVHQPANADGERSERDQKRSVQLSRPSPVR